MWSHDCFLLRYQGHRLKLQPLNVSPDRYVDWRETSLELCWASITERLVLSPQLLAVIKIDLVVILLTRDCTYTYKVERFMHGICSKVG